MTVGEYIAHYVESFGQHQLKTIDLHLLSAHSCIGPFSSVLQGGTNFDLFITEMVASCC